MTNKTCSRWGNWAIGTLSVMAGTFSLVLLSVGALTGDWSGGAAAGVILAVVAGVPASCVMAARIAMSRPGPWR